MADKVIHKLKRHRYLEPNGRDWLETRGFQTGPPTHYETACGLRFKHSFKSMSATERAPEHAHGHWKPVTCPACLKYKKDLTLPVSTHTHDT